MLTEGIPTDRPKADRFQAVLPQNATWLAELRERPPMRRLQYALVRDADACLRAIDNDDVDFSEPRIQAAYETFVAALRHFLEDEVSGLFPPDSPAAQPYLEIPPEWRRTDPARYTQTLQSLAQARDDLLDRYKELMNIMSQQGHMSDPTPTPGQKIDVTSGDGSQISLSAPFASVTGSGSASVGTSEPAADAPAVWYRSGVLWAAVSAIAAVATVIVAIVYA
ncbi:hypothetical protein ACFVJK_38865 [Streptomyces sp. NPDC127172]|uniref:hypothetical protein n=1 Tax=Streptomyces sp. NPDC127172 TaxID=3345382 RepID=UPI0036456CEC